MRRTGTVSLPGTEGVRANVSCLICGCFRQCDDIFGLLGEQGIDMDE